MKLFDPKIPILDELSEHSEFEKVQEEFSQYDSTYVFNASVRSRRQPILEAYRKCSEYLDDDFCKEICKPGKFIDRLWELQICFVLISSGHEVIKRTSGRKFARPDFCIKNKAGKKIWIEAVCADIDDGEMFPKKPEMKTGMIVTRTKKISDALSTTSPRMTTGLAHKYLKKLPKYKNNPEFNNKEDMFVIALNTHKISHEQSGLMSEELVLYGMGIQWIKQDGQSGRYFHWAVEKEKGDGTKVEVEVALFHRREYSELSAVITSRMWFDFSSEMLTIMSNNMNIYFNHRANLPIDHSEFNFGKINYMTCDNELCELKRLG